MRPYKRREILGSDIDYRQTALPFSNLGSANSLASTSISFSLSPPPPPASPSSLPFSSRLVINAYQTARSESFMARDMRRDWNETFSATKLASKRTNVYNIYVFCIPIFAIVSLRYISVTARTNAHARPCIRNTKECFSA